MPNAPTPPVLLFDGDCAFCSSTARWLVRTVPAAGRVVAWQHADLDALGTDVSEVEAAVVFVGVDGRRRHGPDAFAAHLSTSTSRGWRVAGRVLALRPVLAVSWPIYRLIARNRHRLPGGTPQCSLPQAERDRAEP